jgi:hypothetical protein
VGEGVVIVVSSGIIVLEVLSLTRQACGLGSQFPSFISLRRELLYIYTFMDFLNSSMIQGGTLFSDWFFL